MSFSSVKPGALLKNGRYKLLHRIGKSLTAQVFAAQDMQASTFLFVTTAASEKNTVAIKLCYKFESARQQDEHEIGALQNEYEIWKQVNNYSGVAKVRN